eukprot:4432962-Prymnesium_polylepis.1
MARVFKPYKIQVSVQYKGEQDCVGLTVWDWQEIKGDVAAACPGRSSHWPTQTELPAQRAARVRAQRGRAQD